MTVHRQAGGQVVDAKARKQGIGMLVFGIGFTILGAVLVSSEAVDGIGSTEDVFLGAYAIAGAAGVYLTVAGIVLRHIPTADATVAVEEGGVELRLTDGTILIPWEDVDHWGLVRSHLFAVRQVVLWPVAAPAVATIQAARRLWSRRRHGWVLCFDDSGKTLVAALTDAAPLPRHDGSERASA